MAEAVTAVSHLFMVPKLSICCTRAQFGPLTYVSALVSDSEATFPAGYEGLKRYVGRNHLEGQGDPGCVSLVGGGDARWYFQFEPSDPTPGGSIGKELQKVQELVSRLIWFRERSWANQPSYQRDHMRDVATISVDIYLPWYMTCNGNLKKLQVWLDDQVKQELKDKKVPKNRSAKDSWRLGSMESAPACEACGFSQKTLT